MDWFIGKNENCQSITRKVLKKYRLEAFKVNKCQSVTNWNEIYSVISIPVPNIIMKNLLFFSLRLMQIMIWKIHNNSTSKLFKGLKSGKSAAGREGGYKNYRFWPVEFYAGVRREFWI